MPTLTASEIATGCLYPWGHAQNPQACPNARADMLHCSLHPVGTMLLCTCLGSAKPLGTPRPTTCPSCPYTLLPLLDPPSLPSTHFSPPLTLPFLHQNPLHTPQHHSPTFLLILHTFSSPTHCLSLLSLYPHTSLPVPLGGPSPHSSVSQFPFISAAFGHLSPLSD